MQGVGADREGNREGELKEGEADGSTSALTIVFSSINSVNLFNWEAISFAGDCIQPE
jgi:hypothetical protein